MKAPILIILSLAYLNANSQSAKPDQQVGNNCQKCDTIEKEAKTYHEKDILYYHFRCKKFIWEGNLVKEISKTKLKYGKEFHVKVIHVNRYLYDIKMTADQVDFGSDEPALFKNFFKGDSEILNKLFSKVAEEKTNKDSLNPLIESIKGFQGKYYQMLDNQIKVFYHCPQQFDTCCRQPAGDETFSKLATSLFELKANVEKFKIQVSVGLSDLDKELKKKIKDLDDCKSKYKALDQKLAEETDHSKKTKIKKEMDGLNCDEFAKDTSRIGDSKRKLEGQQQIVDAYWMNLSKITDAELMRLYLHNRNAVTDHFEYLSPPIYPKGNRLSLGIHFTPNDSALILSQMPLYDDSVGLDLFVKGKWFLFFSTGPFFGLGKKFVDDTYAYLPIRDSNNIVSDSSQFKLVNTGASKVPPGIGAFAHFGTKFSSGFGVGITTGVGLTIENNPRPIYFLGPNISLGDNNQFSISGGCAITQVEKVKSELYPDFENTIFETKPTAGISYSKKTATGWFVSLSYTVFTMNKTRNSSSKSKK